MSQTNIGPCQCCGQAAGCPCSQINCLFVWEFVADPINANMWVAIDLCGGGDGSTMPCCNCTEPDTPGDYLGEMRLTWCFPIANGNDQCNCFSCTITWDGFLEQWIPGTCIGPDNSPSVYDCSCPTAGIDPGTSHGQTIENIICGCPS